MPGYTGYIPKVPPTDIGLGLRYHNASERGLKAFANDYLRYKSANALPSLTSHSLQLDNA